MPAEVSLAICSILFGGVLERLPTLRIAFAHGGGAFPGTFGRIAHGFEVRPDLVAVDNKVHPRAYLGRFWVDSLVHDADTLRSLVGFFGPSKVMLGSDYPFPLGESVPGTLIRSLGGLPAATQAGLLGDNAWTWLGRKSVQG
jgi:aminocarboxymuconate-semialdehyde decarboxylase